MDPQRELVTDVDCFRIRSCPKLFQTRPLRSLNLSVQVRRARGNRPEPYGFIHQAALNLLSEEFRASIRLDPLDRERHLLQYLIQEGQRGSGGSASGQTGYKVPAAVIDRRELDEPACGSVGY
jgi:hypothetical protein